MKIERISENQIRCTLNKTDLEDRDLLLNELAYGTDKAKALFRDMMQQASSELGFEAEDIPLMIEAIPVSPECLILVITKVEDPEELDTRFSKFSKPNIYEAPDDEKEEELLDGAQNIMEFLNEIDSKLDHLGLPKDYDDKEESSSNKKTAIGIKKSGKKPEKDRSSNDSYKIFMFSSLSDVTAVSNLLNPIYQGKNCLYKDVFDNQYYLAIYKSGISQELYNKVCNILSEYGKKTKSTYASMAYMKEHYQVVIADNAVEVLTAI